LILVGVLILTGEDKHPEEALVEVAPEWTRY
jgi:hypothetical protein